MRQGAVAFFTAVALVVGGCGAGEDAADTTSTTGDTTSTSGRGTTTTVGDRRSDCSAADLDPDLREQAGLPEAVAETRRQIVEAAITCDYETLGDLAAGTDGGSFTYSFGDTGDPARFWQRQEEEGTGEPLRHLVGILDRPHAIVDAGGVIRYAWPSAFTYDSWDEVPETEREALRPLYGDDAFRSFEEFGGYIGYRVLILEDGTWTVFVAGD